MTILRNQQPLAVFALIDARAGEVAMLRRDSQDILSQCATEAQTVPVVIGLAIQEIEIWMLADPHSRQAALGQVIEHLVPADLEAVGDPKSLWAYLAGGFPCPGDGHPELHSDNQRRAAWESLRPEVVGHLCPSGFAPFSAAAQKAVRSVFRLK